MRKRGGVALVNQINQLQDDSRFPFGKHRGELMMDVPAQYYAWLWHNGMKNDKTSNVADYIRRNLDALKMEYPDGIWS